MKPFSKIANLLLVIIIAATFIGVSAFYGKEIRAFLGWRTTTTIVDNSNSELFKLLILPENSPPSFSWYSVQLTQSTNEDSAENDFRESATSILGGFYQGHEIGIINHIVLYRDDESSNKSFLDLPSDLTPNDSSNLELLVVSNLQRQRCLYFTNKLARCNIWFVGSNKLFFIEVEVKKVSDYSIAVEALNAWLSKLEVILE